MSEKTYNQIIEMSQKYKLTDLERVLLAQKERFNKSEYTVGIIGEKFYLPKCLSVILPEMKPYLSHSRRSFYIKFIKGRKAEFCQILPEDENIISLDQFKTLITEKPNVESKDIELPLIYGKMFVKDGLPNDINLTAFALGSDFETEKNSLSNFLIETDVCYVVLSSIKLLSSIEKRLIKDELQNARREYLLMDFAELAEEDKTEVIETLKTFDPDGNIRTICNKEDIKDLKDSWITNSKNVEELAKLRERAAIFYGKSKFLEHLSKKRDIFKITDEQISPIILNLSNVRNDIPSKQRNSMFKINHFLENIKIETQKELMDFNIQMHENLKIGIDEEDDLAQLQKVLPAYVGGSWQEFISETLTNDLLSKEKNMVSSLEQDICDNIDDLLKKYLSEEEYKEIQILIYDSINNGYDIPLDGGDMLPNDDVSSMFHGKIKKSFQNLMPGIFAAAGGLAVLSSVFIPGIAFMLIGYKIHKQNNAAQKSQLLEQGIECSNQYFSSIEKEFEQSFKSARKMIESRVEKCYEIIFDKFVKILEKHQNDQQIILNELTDLEKDIDSVFDSI